MYVRISVAATGDPCPARCSLFSICCVFPSTHMSPSYSIIGHSLYDPSSLPIYSPSVLCKNSESFAAALTRYHLIFLSFLQYDILFLWKYCSRFPHQTISTIILVFSQIRYNSSGIRSFTTFLLLPVEVLEATTYKYNYNSVW